MERDRPPLLPINPDSTRVELRRMVQPSELYGRALEQAALAIERGSPVAAREWLAAAREARGVMEQG